MYNVDTMKHTIGGEMAQGVSFCLRVGAKWSISIFVYIFLIAKEYDYIFLILLIQYIHCRKIPAKYHDNRLGIVGWDQIFISYAILPRLPVHVCMCCTQACFV